MELIGTKIITHLGREKQESSRQMSGLVAALHYSPEEILIELKHLIETGLVERYGNGKRHAYKISTSSVLTDK